MQYVLETDFSQQAKWLEEKSKTTFENAKYTKFILNKNSISEFVLVTHAYHMPRAMWSFRHEGMNPTPAPTVFYKRNRMITDNNEFIPQSDALAKTRLALGEYIAKFAYKYLKS